jgi:hypothetical protein
MKELAKVSQASYSPYMPAERCSLSKHSMGTLRHKEENRQPLCTQYVRRHRICHVCATLHGPKMDANLLHLIGSVVETQ